MEGYYGFSITGNASKLHQTYDDNNTKVSVQLSQSTLLSPLNFPNTNLGLKYNTFHQLIRTTSNLRFEIRELAKKMDTMDQRLTDTIVNTSSTVRENNNLSCESSWDLPFTTIENFELFEEKLSDNLFRKKVINQLSRYERSTIAETTKQMTSKIFHNNLLSQYSYHGQKYKSIVRSIRKYNCCPDMDISKPLKIYMANVKAREDIKQRKNKDLISNSS
ncbi:hypothetical protein AGLY_011123 [Aphis glycines]|uniref:DUF4806 domain-containing protein n=1 Tax=Aphis glycines TaxID=307491 RepID=A0A6G0TEP4_APHGL|nr:hypothetical protein AGLY_011123 [Aphis glycines]